MLEKMGLDVMRFQDDVLGMPRPESPTRLRPSRRCYLRAHLNEELNELDEARTVEDQADALLDMTYIVLGRLLEMGVPIAAWDEVQRANMERKGVGRTGRSEYDAVKPDGWTAPDLSLYCSVTRDEMDTIQALRSGLAGVVLTGGNGKVGTSAKVRDITREVCGRRPHPKILILGHGRHGKDTVAEMLRDHYDLSFQSSSEFCAQDVCMPYFAERLGVVYEDAEQCFKDRHGTTAGKPNRAHWFDAITEFNRPDASALGRALFAKNDVYCGLRSAREFHAVKAAGLYDLCVWVDASGRGVPPEDRSSCTVEPWMADHVLDNSGDLVELAMNLDRVMDATFGYCKACG